ncbi:MAG: DUF362 domain-containing protein [Chloroflexota bacterium]|nr:DUF362 domain-containing protein [Chloroflexota bacterium]
MASHSRDWRSIFGLRGASRLAFEEVEPKQVVSTALHDTRGRSLVARTRFRGDARSTVQRVLELLAGDQPLLSWKDSPLVVPRFSPEQPPWSTSPDFLAALVHALRSQGAGSVRVLDARTAASQQPADLWETCERAGCEVIDASKGDWVRVRLPGGAVTVPRVAYESDRLVLLPSPLASTVTRFSMALALAGQLVHPRDRGGHARARHEEHLVELNLAVRPWLCVLDARKAVIDAELGTVREPGYVFASGDPVALDVAAIKLLKGYPAKNHLDLPAWTFPQITAAIRLGLGAGREDSTRLVEG